MHSLERRIAASQFLSKVLTSKERILVASFALGYNQAEIARAFSISPAAVNQMTTRIMRKAAIYWQ